MPVSSASDTPADPSGPDYVPDPNGTAWPGTTGDFLPGWQQVGALYQILPYIEQTNLTNASNSTTGAGKIPIYFCPSRRAPVARGNMGLTDYAWPNGSTTPPSAFTSDQRLAWYRGFPGSATTPSLGASIIAQGGFELSTGSFTGGYPAEILANPGKRFVRAQMTKFPHITDGLSNTLLYTEKYLPTRFYTPPATGNAWWDESYSHGAHLSANRSIGSSSHYLAPNPGILAHDASARPDQNPSNDDSLLQNQADYIYGFGSAHPAGLNAVMGDGSVRSFAYTTPHSLWLLICRRDDGSVIPFE